MYVHHVRCGCARVCGLSRFVYLSYSKFGIHDEIRFSMRLVSCLLKVTKDLAVLSSELVALVGEA